jgi:peptide/nickel transport system permease protein
MAAVETLTPELDLAPARRAWVRKLTLSVPVGLVGFVLAGCFLGPLVLPIPAPTGGNVLESALPAFSPGHLLGTDPNGNDILSRILYGGRASLIVTIAVNLIGLSVGGLLGALSGYVGGALDTVIMRVLDVLIAFPSLVLTLAVAQSLGPSLTNTILALAFFSIPAFARVSRAATLGRVLLRHVAPNIGPQLITFSMLGMGIVIIIEGALSFLGLGIPAPDPSWGNMVAQGQASLSATPDLVVWPSLALFVSVLAFNLLGEALRTQGSVR